MTTEHESLTFPADRRLRLWIRPSMLVMMMAAAVAPVVVAWVFYLVVGLPKLRGLHDPTLAEGPHGFPLWLRMTHYLNFLFLVLMTRSGLSILMDHPRLYWNVHCTPGTEWLRLTPLKVPTDRTWTSKDDARYVSPWLALPGARHTVGIARHWHFLVALMWTATGVFFVTMLMVSGEWRRIVPLSLRMVPEAWAVMVHYATFHLPTEPDGFYRYNALQLLAYFGVVFVMPPVTMLTGLAMSPAIDSRYRWYARIFGGRQAARSIHFLLVLGYLGFTAVHVLMVVISGLAQNMNHIVLGSDETGVSGLVLGALGIGVIVLVCVGTHWVSWHRPRVLQYAALHVVERLMKTVLNRMAPRAQFQREDISPHFWANGKMPTSEAWRRLAGDAYRDYRLKVHGLVARPGEFSLEELRAIGKQEQITMHHCIQGWSGIAQWAGLPLSALIERVGPTPEARFVVCHSFGEGPFGGEYYDCLALSNALHPQSLLAYEMNDAPLSDLHGAPLRLRVENQLGYKMVKWIRPIEFVAGVDEVGKGHGGKNEDDEYFDLTANI